MSLLPEVRRTAQLAWCRHRKLRAWSAADGSLLWERSRPEAQAGSVTALEILPEADEDASSRIALLLGSKLEVCDCGSVGKVALCQTSARAAAACRCWPPLLAGSSGRRVWRQSLQQQRWLLLQGQEAAM